MLAPTFGCSHWLLLKTYAMALFIKIILFKIRSRLSESTNFEIQELGKWGVQSYVSRKQMIK